MNFVCIGGADDLRRINHAKHIAFAIDVIGTRRSGERREVVFAFKKSGGSGHGGFIERPWIMVSAAEIEGRKNAAAIDSVAIRFPLREPTRMEIVADFLALDDADRRRQQSVQGALKFSRRE